MGNGSAPHLSHPLPGNSGLASSCSHGDGEEARKWNWHSLILSSYLGQPVT